MTGFYPLYNGANDQVDPVSSIARSAFQRVIPRYRLSSSETRDTGLGPAFYDVPVYRSISASRPDRQAGAELERASADTIHGSATTMRKPPVHDWQGRHVDIYA